MLFDFEKEKAKWQMEYDNVLSQKRELEDVVVNLERRKDLLFKENERLKAEWKANRSSVDGRSQRGGEGPRLGLPLSSLGGLNTSITSSASGLPPSSQASVLKSRPGVLNQATQQPNGSFSSQRASLGANLNLSLQNQNKQLPPQPYKFSFPVQQLQGKLDVGIGQMYQQHLNNRYAMQQTPQSADENAKVVGQDMHQEAGGEDSYTGHKQPVVDRSPRASGQFQPNSFTLNNNRTNSTQNLKTSSRYQEQNNENF